MAKKLKAVGVGKQTKPGLYPDGAGLYLQVTGSSAKSWLYRYTINQKTRSMGLGSALDDGLSLAAARDKRDELRALVVRGIDPLEARDAARAQAKIGKAKSITFKEAATEYIATHRAGWHNVKHAAQWESTLKTYAYPTLGALPVSEIDTAAVLKVLQPIWATKRDTANRLRGRIEAIMDWAKARDFRAGENPARWRGHLNMLLATKRPAPKHHAALPFDQIGTFMADLRSRDGIGALALDFTILTVARTAETLGASWSEIDMGERLWVIPADRMKGNREHRVPLSDAAMAVLEKMRALGLTGEHVFPNIGRKRPLSNMAMLKQLERMNHADITVHGFRSTFRDWASERTNFQNEVIEMALAHAIGDAVEAAYRRGDLLDKRRRLMDAWGEYCASTVSSSAVVPIRAVVG